MIVYLIIECDCEFGEHSGVRAFSTVEARDAAFLALGEYVEFSYEKAEAVIDSSTDNKGTPEEIEQG